MGDHHKEADEPDESSPIRQLQDAAEAEKAIADSIEDEIGMPASIEEAEMLEAAELLEVELPEE